MSAEEFERETIQKIMYHTSYYKVNQILYYQDTKSNAIEAPDSLTDEARGLVGKRGDTAMRERFISFK